MTRLPDVKWRPLTLADMTRESPLLLDLTFVLSDQQIADLEEQKRAFFWRIGRETPRQKVERLVLEDRAARNDGRWVPVWRKLHEGIPCRVRGSRVTIDRRRRYRWEYRR